ncbi:hypothetical protein AAVH_27325 [Aphelenchoides avenae]|nr:hypothetical protein AAVH_27325 [Aphelenchus avenae]
MARSAQHFGLTLDGDFNALHVFSVLMQEPTGTSCTADISRKRFDDAASKTYVNLEFHEQDDYESEPYQNLCTIDGDEVSGWYSDGFNDTVQVGSVRQPSVTAWLIVEVNAPLNPAWKADGIFGIGPSYKGYAWGNTIGTFLKAFERPQITLYYAR